MKKKSFSKVSINIMLISIILSVGLLVAFYGLNIDKVVNDTNDFFDESEEERVNASLVKCVDGDTVKLKVKNENIKVRFLAIDTPEINKEELGKVASNYTCNSLKKAKDIKISYENGLTHTDKYGRHLVWIYVDNELLQEKLIDIGYAKVRYIYAKYKYTNKLLKLQKLAQEKKVGIWSNYKAKKYNNDSYVIVFKYDGTSKSIEVKSGVFPSLINNPHQKDYTFSGWMSNNKLYDFSRPITQHIIVEAKFDK